MLKQLAYKFILCWTLLRKSRHGNTKQKFSGPCPKTQGEKKSLVDVITAFAELEKKKENETKFSRLCDPFYNKSWWIGYEYQLFSCEFSAIRSSAAVPRVREWSYCIWMGCAHWFSWFCQVILVFAAVIDAFSCGVLTLYENLRCCARCATGCAHCQCTSSVRANHIVSAPHW